MRCVRLNNVRTRAFPGVFKIKSDVIFRGGERNISVVCAPERVFKALR